MAQPEQRRGHRYLDRSSRLGHSIDYRDRLNINYRDRSQIEDELGQGVDGVWCRAYCQLITKIVDDRAD